MAWLICTMITATIEASMSVYSIEIILHDPRVQFNQQIEFFKPIPSQDLQTVDKVVDFSELDPVETEYYNQVHRLPFDDM